METSDAGAQCQHMISRLRERRKTTGNWFHNLLVQFLHQVNAQKRGKDHAEQLLESSTNVTQNQVVQFLPDDLLLKIFILLPAESLVRIRFVCKRWFVLITNPTFVRLHAHQSETLLICHKLAFARKKHSERTPQSYFHLMDFYHGRDNFFHSDVVGLVNVLSSCDGLVLVGRKNNMSLILTNPVTRKYTELPRNMVTTSWNESYSLAFCDKENTYKVVHLFSEQPGYRRCGILSISTRKWKLVEGFTPESLPSDRQKTVCVNGSCHWMPKNLDRFVSVNLQDEKFVSRNLPIHRQVKDKLVEIGGVLGFATRETHDLMQVWILDENGDESKCGIWINRWRFNLNFGIRAGVVPICCPRNGEEMVFSHVRGEHLYVYNFSTGDIKLVYSRDAWYESMDKTSIPHRNTLVSWKN